MKVKKYSYFLAFGLLSFVVGQALSFANSDLAYIHFSEGLFMGLSIPLNIFGIYLAGKELRRKFQH